MVSLIIWLLHGNDIEPTVSAHSETSVIRIRKGDAISTFLPLIGAVSSIFEFENIRVSREVTGNVNRVINCDSGNARRQVDAGARRTELFMLLLAFPESASLPKELLTEGSLHIENPGLSITELGRLMDPQISKSGMNHRLIKLEEIACDL